MLNARIEKEAKMLLSKKEYELLNLNIRGENCTQINTYYLAEKKYILRIRFFPEQKKYLFTLKIKKGDNHLEYEKEITNHSFDDAYIQEVFNHFNIRNIRYLGQAKTIRTTKNDINGQFCLDYSFFGKEKDYELEYELKDATKEDFKTLNMLLKKTNIVYKPNKISKFARFLKNKEKNLKIAIHDERILKLQVLPFIFKHQPSNAENFHLNIFTHDFPLIAKLLAKKRPCILLFNNNKYNDYNLFYCHDNPVEIKKIIKEEILLP